MPDTAPTPPAAPAAAPAPPPPPAAPPAAPAAAAPPPAPAAPPAPPPDLMDRKAARVAKLKKEEAAAKAAAAAPKDPPPVTPPANDNAAPPPADPTKADPPKTDPSKPEAPPVEAKPEKPVEPAEPDPDRVDIAALIRRQRELARKEKDAAKARADFEASQKALKEREEAIAKREAALKDVDPDLTLARSIKDARTKKDIVAAVRTALGDGVDLNDVLLAVAGALPDADGTPKPAASAAPAAPTLTPEEIKKIAKEEFSQELTARQKAEEDETAKEIATARAAYIDSIHKVVDREVEHLPHVASLKPEDLEKRVDAIVEAEDKAGRPIPSERAVVRHIETSMAIAAHPRECYQLFRKDPSKYPLLAEPEFAVSEQAAMAYARDFIKAQNRLPTAEETLKAHHDYWQAKLDKLRPKPEEPPKKPPAPTVTSDWKATAGGGEPPKLETLEQRKADRKRRLDDAEAHRRAAKG